MGLDKNMLILIGTGVALLGTGLFILGTRKGNTTTAYNQTSAYHSYYHPDNYIVSGGTRKHNKKNKHKKTSKNK